MKKVEYFDPNKYQCWLTGIGTGRLSPKHSDKPSTQVTEYLKREKKEKNTNHFLCERSFAADRTLW